MGTGSTKSCCRTQEAWAGPTSSSVSVQHGAFTSFRGISFCPCGWWREASEPRVQLSLEATELSSGLTEATSNLWSAAFRFNVFLLKPIINQNLCFLSFLALPRTKTSKKFLVKEWKLLKNTLAHSNPTWHAQTWAAILNRYFSFHSYLNNFLNTLPYLETKKDFCCFW